MKGTQELRRFFFCLHARKNIFLSNNFQFDCLYFYVLMISLSIIVIGKIRFPYDRLFSGLSDKRK